MPPKFRFGRKNKKEKQQQDLAVPTSPSNEELTSSHISSSSPPENVGTKKNGSSGGPWDMTTVESSQPTSKNPFDNDEGDGGAIHMFKKKKPIVREDYDDEDDGDDDNEEYNDDADIVTSQFSKKNMNNSSAAPVSNGVNNTNPFASTNPFANDNGGVPTNSTMQRVQPTPTANGIPSSQSAQPFPSSGGFATTPEIPTTQPKPTMSRQGYTKHKNIAQSAGTSRLNRILSQTAKEKISYIPEEGENGNEDHGDIPLSASWGGKGGPSSTIDNATSGKAGAGKATLQDELVNPRISKNRGKVIKVDDPLNEVDVASFVSRIVVPQLRVDIRSIGGSVLIEDVRKAAKSGGNEKSKIPQIKQNLVQETLVTARCKSFETTGGDAISPTALDNPSGYARHKRSLGSGGKARNKLRYVLLVRSTNKPLLGKLKKMMAKTRNKNASGGGGGGGDIGDPSNYSDGNVDYEDLYSSNTGGMDIGNDIDDPMAVIKSKLNNRRDNKNGAADNFDNHEAEVSSFPVLVCMALHSDGTNPDIRKMIELDQLTTIQNVHTSGVSGSSIIQLAFRDGDTVRIDFGVPEQPEDATSATMRKERFLWSLLQIHAMLCTSVVERNSLEGRSGNANARDPRSTVRGGGNTGGLLPPLNVRNLDRAELQYIATVNGFLRDSPTLCALLDRQRDIASHDRGDSNKRDGGNDGSRLDGDIEEEKEVPLEEMDGMAYDMMMGNYATRVALFVSAEERADAEEVLNAIDWDHNRKQQRDDGHSYAVSAAENIAGVLHKRMHDLEAETCRRLIAWEDEKHYSLTGQTGLFTAERDTVDALSLASLFSTLDTLDSELGDMEKWLHEREAEIRPLINDSREIEEENRQLEQNWKSCAMLGQELVSILHDLNIPGPMEKILYNPAGALTYTPEGAIDMEPSEKGVDKIHDAGKYLKDALDRAKEAGAVHLLAVSQRAESLNSMADTFCTGLANIVATVMEQIASQVVAESDHGKVSKADTHKTIAEKIRNTQRKFQSSLLGYIKLIEILQQLKPSLLPAIRDAYAEMVAEGILMKKRMKGYFQALPGKNSAYLSLVTMDLKDFGPFGEKSGAEQTVNATDITFALGELLPIIAREAYFTAALFGLSSKQLDGREKKRNFESAKKSVDHASQYFRYYISRTVGIVAESESEKVRGDPMLSLVSSIHLNDAMENYIDREKKGGDQSLSLAYIRATILDLRKKVDKQWVIWIEEQIEWIKTNPGVPLNGKRAGVFASFCRFPSYLDHILRCLREGKEDYTPQFADIKVVSYYLQKLASALLESLRECAERETTDQQYAANVMRMENTYYFTQSIKQRDEQFAILFQKQLAKASAICKQSTDAYLGWMIKREFKLLHALFSNISRIRRDVGDKDVPIHVPRATFVKTLQKESNREVMKEKIQTIYSRMEKHLSENGGLLPIAWKALVKVLYEWFGRWEKLSSQCYKHVLEPSAVDVVRIAKAAGGSVQINREASGR